MVQVDNIKTRLGFVVESVVLYQLDPRFVMPVVSSGSFPQVWQVLPLILPVPKQSGQWLISVTRCGLSASSAALANA